MLKIVMKILQLVTLLVYFGIFQDTSATTTEQLVKEIQDGVVRYADKGFEQILKNTQVLTLEAMKRTFQEFDKDSNGTMEFDEFTDFGYQSNRTRVAILKQKLFDAFDTNSDNKLQMSEWTAVYYQASTSNNTCHLNMVEYINFIKTMFENIIADYLTEMGISSSG